MKTQLIYKSKPSIGVDIGHNSIKAVQLEPQADYYSVVGYGFEPFPSQAVNSTTGIIEDPASIASSIKKLLTSSMVGGVTTDRIVAALPVARTYSRIIQLPYSEKNNIRSAIELEVEQYVPVSLDDLYVDYEITYESPDKEADELEILTVAAPKALVDSYVALFDLLGLEVQSLETSLNATVRAVNRLKNGGGDLSPSNILDNTIDISNPGNVSLLIDFGAESSDLSLFDRTVRITGTVNKGGNTFTAEIASTMHIPERQAQHIKTRYGISSSKHQAEVMKAIDGSLQSIVKEIKKMQRYYLGRTSATGDITNISIIGGGANMPGLAEYLESQTSIPTTICNPWQDIDFKKLQEPHAAETTIYTTAIGLALLGARPQ